MGFTLELGAAAPDFSLPATDGKTYALEDFEEARCLVVFFTCNHCPYVLGSDDLTAKTAMRFAKKGRPLRRHQLEQRGHAPGRRFRPHGRADERGRTSPGPYLRDKGQDAAKAYGALRTPHFLRLRQRAEVGLHGPRGRQSEGGR